MPDDPRKPDRTDAIKKAWGKWLLIFVPLFAASMVAIYFFGFSTTLPVILAILVGVILYQRFLKKRN
ncbi:MAG: hypothetical protein QNK92_14610 [Amylibacter sp.]